MKNSTSFGSSFSDDNFESDFDDNDPNNNSSQANEGRSRAHIVRDDSGLVSTAPIAEKAILVGVDLAIAPQLMPLEDSLTELALLAKTAGVSVAGEVTQRLETPNPATLIGSGKLEELEMMVQDRQANVVIFDDELSPRQQREIEKVLGQEVKVLDRTALILDIFARHARTREGSVQVELAQYEYRLPRLTRAWTHLARQAGGRAGGAGGGVGVRGPGETQLEVDRREISRRIAFLKRQLEEIRKHRDQYRRNRRKNAMPVVALVGYTNAGKSTLLNALTNAQVRAEDQLFATLDPTTRRATLPSGHEVLLTDTVGFIQKLPTQLIAAFRATLEEVTEADVLIHVVDASHANAEDHIAAVDEVLEELGAGSKPQLMAFNKIDRMLKDAEAIADVRELMAEYPYAVALSAATGQNLDELLATLDKLLRERMVPMDLLIPYAHGELVNLAHTHGFIEDVEHLETGTHLRGRIPLELAARYAGYWFNPLDPAQYVDRDDRGLTEAIEEYQEADLEIDSGEGREEYLQYEDDELDDDLDGYDLDEDQNDIEGDNAKV
ncbi:MAG: GTPase HflX [Caldilineaceae bacterium]|nr:GTPase HflX [Caldilineaceae bacterium]